MKTQKDLVKEWYKIELNSSYGIPPVTPLIKYYDKNKARQITEKGKKNLMLTQKSFEKIGLSIEKN